MRLLQSMTVGVGLAAWGFLAVAQPAIFTCVDGKGRRLTADRPIAECTDRVQKELSPGGTVKRVVPPSFTAEEIALQEEAARKAAEEANRAAEEKRRDRALLARYPNQAAHEKERAAAIQVVDDVIVTATKRATDLVDERKGLSAEFDTYKGNEAKIPVRLKRLIEENTLQQVAQRRFLAEQAAEKHRLNARFDLELARLKGLWSPQAAALPATATRKP